MNYLYKQSNQIRIIGGTHRGRKLSFPNLPGLRPTGDRMRETLFNWLQPIIGGASCLDLFAGSGALGFEAASRNAGRVVMLDIAPPVITQLKHHLDQFKFSQIEIYQIDALQWLQEATINRFDIVFLDPPFATNLATDACNLLLQYQWLKERAWLYLEQDLKSGRPSLPSSLCITKEKHMGQVWCGLIHN